MKDFRYHNPINEIPDNYYSNLFSYEEFIIKTNLFGFEVSDEVVLNSLYKVEKYYYIVINGHLCFLDNKGNKAENVVIKGDFNCFALELISLEGCPKEVGGNFRCSGNQLISLKGCLKEVRGYFNCSDNQLTSLEGCPEKIGGSFNCSENQLTSLEGCPEKVGGNFYCFYNSKKLSKPNRLKCKNFYN